MYYAFMSHMILYLRDCKSNTQIYPAGMPIGFALEPTTE